MKELSLNILDIAQNSVKAGAAYVEILLNQTGNLLTITIKDDGCGMPEAFLRSVTDPFTTTRTTRKVGMGIPLFKLAAEQTGGRLSITSKQAEERDPSHGTTISATFYTDHLDCEPLGDVASTVTTLIQGSPELHLTYVHTVDGAEQRLSTDEMREMLGEDISLSDPAVLTWVRDFINEPIG
jgi:hypothetical protein